MGTGEGAQAFGKGHYLAERPGIAKVYAEMHGKRMYDKVREFDPAFEELTSKENLERKIQEGNLPPNVHQYIQHALTKSDDPQSYINAAVEGLESDYEGMLKRYGAKHQKTKELADLLDQFKLIAPEYYGSGKQVVKGPLSSLYEVSLEWPGARESVDPMSREHFFQWDKAFKNQPEHVKQALMDIAESNTPEYNKYIEDMSRFYGGSKFDPMQLIQMRPETSIRDAGLEQQLYQRGVPGVAFLDQPSRAAPKDKRTYNYVSFGNEIPRILSHNKPSVLKMLWPEYNK
jgi:hypothetical protein